MWIDKKKSLLPKNPYTMYIVAGKALQVANPDNTPLPKNIATGTSTHSYRDDRSKSDEPILYWDLSTNEMTAKQGVITEVHIVLDKLGKIDWVITKEKKKIGPFLCYKAMAKVRGRKYTAWFAPEIPISAGPWKLGGLPGMILEAEDDTKEVQFEFLSLSLNAPIVYEIEPIKTKKRNVTTINAIEIPALRQRIRQNMKKMDDQMSSKFEGVVVTSTFSKPVEAEIYENEVWD